MPTSKFKRTALVTGLGMALLGAAALVQLPSQPELRSVIVQGRDLDSVMAAVQSVGGEITHELGIIRSVGARLTANQHAALAESASIVRLYADRSVEVSANNSIQSVVDNFSDVSYANNDGTKPWSDDWVEFNDDGDVDSGRVKIKSGRLQLKKPSRGVHRSVDLSASSSATLSFSYRRKSLVSDKEHVTVELSGNGGGTWSEIARVAGPANDSGYLTTSVDISEWVGVDTLLRFKTSPDLGKYPVYVDNVEILYSVSPGSQGASQTNGSPFAPCEPSSDQYLNTCYPTLTGADALHAEGIRGDGVTVAVLDSGMWNKSHLIDDSHGYRVLAQYDVNHPSANYEDDIHDDSGHGSHVTSVILSHGQTSDGHFNGMAPEADLVAVRAFDGNGAGTYIGVISAIDWLVAHKDDFNIRVLNLSFSATPRSYYFDDPLNQAVMAAWDAGIVVVASAGNTGPDPMTIGVPGNVPYVITVGAMTDNYTPENPSDDMIASFSAAGPTHAGFVKPELVAPGGHILGLMDGSNHQIALDYPEFVEPTYQEFYTMSGTSQAAAVVTGVVALLFLM